MLVNSEELQTTLKAKFNTKLEILRQSLAESILASEKQSIDESSGSDLYFVVDTDNPDILGGPFKNIPLAEKFAKATCKGENYEVMSEKEAEDFLKK